MNDLDVAKRRLKERKLSLVFVKDSTVIFETGGEGLGGFLRAIGELNGSLAGASVADKTIGKAAALLCAYSRVKAAFAITMSKSGQETLETHSIYHEFDTLTQAILNRQKTDKCPFEKLVESTNNPEEAYEEIGKSCGL
jgi:hypothetical protein